MDALIFGKPMLAFPFFADQPTLAGLLEDRGAALTIKLSVQDITEKAKRLLNDER